MDSLYRPPLTLETHEAPHRTAGVFVNLPVTAGKLDLGPWQQVFYAEFDGQRRKRLVIKVKGE